MNFIIDWAADLSSDSIALRHSMRFHSAIRVISIVGQVTALTVFSTIIDIGLPVVPLSMAILLYTLVTMSAWLRLRLQKPVTQLEFFVQIVIDVLFYTTVFHFSGGPSNPFISFYLVSISIAVAVLPLRYGFLTAFISLLSYTILLKFYVSIPALEHAVHDEGFLNLHILGMWGNFVISALLIVLFVGQMAKSLRQQEQVIAEFKEDKLHSQQLLTVAGLAAGTAHELGTPLNSIKLVCDELGNDYKDDKRIQEDVELLSEQVAQCRDILKQLVTTASQTKLDSVSPVQVSFYFEQLIERWQLLRPTAMIDLTIQETLSDHEAILHPSIAQSIMSLLNNAADESPGGLKVSISWSRREALILIRDYGRGLDQSQLKLLATPFLTHKPEGMGLGLYLSKTSLDRLGGSVRFSRAEGGGTLTEIRVDLSAKLV